MTWRPLTDAKTPPTTWPQDTLRVPQRAGGMPPVDRLNADVVRAEFFSLSARFQFAAAAAAQTVRQLVPTPQDGDFWCDEIAVVSWKEEVGADSDVQGFLQALVSIRDSATGLTLTKSQGLRIGAGAGLLMTDAVPVNLFRTLPQSGLEGGFGSDYDGSVPVPCGFRSKGALIQPFCFTRQGAIDVSMQTLTAAPVNVSVDVTLGFLGWKEYANASR